MFSNFEFHQIWTRSRASADPDAPHGPDSDPKGYLGTDDTQGIPEQPEITPDCLISQNGRVHKVFVHMLGRRGPRRFGISLWLALVSWYDSQLQVYILV